jgi:hypothetical protein
VPVSFDVAQGKIETAGSRAEQNAAAMLGTPLAQDRAIGMAEGAARFAMAPIAAVVGAFQGGKEMSSAKLAESQRDLAEAMNSAANQRALRDSLLRIAAENTRRSFVASERFKSDQPGQPPVSAILEPRIESMRLVKAGTKGDEFKLQINARTRLLRAADGAVLSDTPFQYESGKDLFINWTLHDAVKRVTDSGYQTLAEQMLAQVLPASQDQTLLLGAGYPHRSGEDAASSPVRAAHRVTGKNQTSGLRFVNNVPPDPGAIGVYSSADVSRVGFPTPLSKDEAASEGVTKVERMLDGLDNHPNSIVMLTACAAAIPMSIWEQTVGLWRGMSEKQAAVANDQLAAAAQLTQPHIEMAKLVAQQLGPQTAQPVMLVRQPLPPGCRDDPELIHCVARGTLAWLPEGQTSSSYLRKQGANTALEIHITRAALLGGDGINPPQALCVEAEATLFRLSDGQEIYSCPIRYRSATHSISTWAAHDARLFREELSHCYAEMSAGIVKQLTVNQVVAPARGVSPTLAEQ